MIKQYCDICEHEIFSLSQLPTKKLRFNDDFGMEHELFVCRHCYHRMCAIIKKSTVKERKAVLKAMKNFNRLVKFDLTGEV